MVPLVGTQLKMSDFKPSALFTNPLVHHFTPAMNLLHFILCSVLGPCTVKLGQLDLG